MPFQIINQDITQFPCDVIVNPTDGFFSGSGGTDRQLHNAAGKELDRECSGLPRLKTGSVAVTAGYDLPCKYVIHTVGPIWQGGEVNEPVLLRSCYINALLAAKKLGTASVAFPLIASGTFGFPKDKVLRIAIDAIADFLDTTDGEMQITICVLDRNAFVLSKEIALNEYLNSKKKKFIYEDHAICMKARIGAMPSEGVPCPTTAAPHESDLAEWIAKQDDTFAVMLLKLIDKKGMTDVACYKKANVSKGTFWKIMNDPNYKPSKATVIAFAIALELTLEETEKLLKTVGFSLSHSNKFDMIIEFYISAGCYDIFEINAALYQHDQVCLGC